MDCKHSVISPTLRRHTACLPPIAGVASNDALKERLPAMQPRHDGRLWNLRALLESTATPFAIVEYRPRVTIFRQGDPCDSVMHIETGRVWLAVTGFSGKEAICALLEKGAFLGEEALVGQGERRQSATAMTATEVLVVAPADVARLLRTQPRLLDAFIAHLLARNSRLEANLTAQFFHSSEQRLAHLLLLLANHNERRPRRPCPLPGLSQEILAEMVGTTRSRVNGFLGRFKKLGFVEKHSGILYVDPGRLPAVLGGHQSVPIAASTVPQAPTPHERHWLLAG
ncbi:MAG TPA: Crp/Fnr family transcriptional regulator [Vicinamibacterales bacterium]